MRDMVHDFTGTLLKENGDLNKILGEGPNYIPAKGLNDGKVCSDIAQSTCILNALCEYPFTIAYTRAFTHDRNIALSLNLNYSNLGLVS